MAPTKDPRAKGPKTPARMWRTAIQLPRALLGLAVIAALCLNVIADDGNWTEIHEAGRCAIKGQCGKKSFFGSELPCPNNDKAEDPDKGTRKKLVAICGDAWKEGDVCCDDAQVLLFKTSAYQ